MEMPRTIQRSVTLTPKIVERAEQFARENGFASVSDLMRKALEKYMDEEDENRRIGQKVSAELQGQRVREELKEIAREVFWEAIDAQIKERMNKLSGKK